MNPIEKALAQADAIIAAQNALEALSREGRLVVIPVGDGPFTKAADAAIAKENANPQGLPADDIEALQASYTDGGV